MTAIASLLDLAPIEAVRISLPSQTAKRSKSIKRRWLQYFLPVSLTSIVLVAPIPLASNHPIAWLFWAGVIGYIGAAHSAFTDRRVALGVVPNVFIWLALSFLAFSVWQCMPAAAQLFAHIFSPKDPTSGAISIAPTATFLAAVRVASYLVFFALALRIAEKREQSLGTAYILFLGITAHATWALISLRLLGDGGALASKEAYLGMVTGTFVNKNSFATFLGMGFVLGLALQNTLTDRNVGRTAGRLRQLAHCLFLSLILVALIYTQSRMGIAATLVAACAVLALSAKPSRPVMLSSALATVAAISLFGGDIWQRVWQLPEAGLIRIDFYRQVWLMIQDRPLSGFGLDSFPLAFEMYHAWPVTAEFVWDKAHSTYLTLWSESGIIFGSIPPIAGVIALCKLWIMNRSDPNGDPLALCGIAALILGGLHSLVDFSLEIQANTFLLLFLVALGLGMSRRRKDIGHEH